jgi:tripartite-type tricarboxylate transporter receptor subunit TctC
MQRRRLFTIIAAAGVAGATTALAAWPERPVRIVVPYAPGGPVDVVARLTGDKLATKFGQSFVIENKPGANGAIGVQAVMAAPADGYTLLMHGSAGVTI